MVARCCSQHLWVSSRSACAAFVDAPCQCGTHQHHANRCRHAEERRNQQRVLPRRCRAVLHHHGADHSRGHSRLISASSAPCIRITRNSTSQMPLTRKARTRWAMSLSLGGGDLGSGSGYSSQQGQPASRAACPCRNPAGSAEYQRCSNPHCQSLIPNLSSRQSSQLDAIEGDIRRHVGVVIHIGALEAEHLEELVLVAGVVGEFEQVLGGDLRP